MATATLKCRVCGKEYEACRSANRIDGVFRWQDVACSPDHGATYLDRIRKSRGKNHDAVAVDIVRNDFSVLDDEYMGKTDDEILYDDLEDDSEDPEIEV